MEQTYYREWISVSNELETAKVEISKLKKENYLLQKQLQELVNEIFEEKLTSEEECPCGGDCGCKGDDTEEIIIP